MTILGEKVDHLVLFLTLATIIGLAVLGVKLNAKRDAEKWRIWNEQSAKYHCTLKATYPHTETYKCGYLMTGTCYNSTTAYLWKCDTGEYWR